MSFQNISKEILPKKYLIIASRKDIAGMNIVEQLYKFGKYDLYIVEGEILHNENLDMERIKPYDFVIFASKHQSEKKEKTLSIHSPGNWKKASMGGQAGKVCKSSALFNKELFEMLHKIAEEHQIQNKFKLTLECTHHGPLINKPCVFIEIGSTEREWNNHVAGFVVAKTIHKTIQTFKENKYREPAIAIGGPHYCPNFNKLQANSNIAISHIIPEYALPLTEEMLKEAIEKTEENIEFAVLDWKGLGNAEQRNETIKILDKLYVRHKRTNQVGKEEANEEKEDQSDNIK